MTDPRIQQFIADAQNVVQYLHNEYAKLQTGRASAALVESIQVDAYGTSQHLKSMAGITVEDAKSIVISPWDKSALSAIERALIEADLGCSPRNDGTTIRIVLPPMTEDRRKHLVKIVQELAEEARISVRQLRDKLREDFKKETDEDLRYGLLENLDKETQKVNEEIDTTKKHKEEEVMTV